jgi:formate hydrogenlyase subunit 3/multisubunit Na+/H+ antiporter MnhD subunit
MRVTKVPYSYLEVHFFNSLARKIVGNILSFFIVTLLLIGLCWLAIDVTKLLLASASIERALSENVQATRSIISYCSAALLVFSLVLFITTVSLLKHGMNMPAEYCNGKEEEDNAT